MHVSGHEDGSLLRCERDEVVVAGVGGSMFRPDRLGPRGWRGCARRVVLASDSWTPGAREGVGVNSGAAATLGKVAEELRRARLIVRVGSEDVAITWSTRNEILKFLQRAPETLHVVLYFENVGGRRPVDLDRDGKQHLFRALRYWHDHPAIGKPFPADAQALLAALADEEAS